MTLAHHWSPRQARHHVVQFIQYPSRSTGPKLFALHQEQACYVVRSGASTYTLGWLMVGGVSIRKVVVTGS